MTPVEEPSRFWARVRLLAVLALVAGAAALGLVAIANWWITRTTRAHIITDRARLPRNDVGLVLGTSPKLRGGWSNPFFEGRIATAAELFHAGKVRHLLVSGDNSRRAYDEPTAMRDALVARGVPVTAITLDYAGFRTLDSMARAGAVFGIRRCTIVTDDFHQPRAVFLARSLGLDAVGFPSRHVPFRWSKKTRSREVASRLKACLDVYLLHTQPKFYGPPVAIPILGTGIR
jgi:SanA protein